MNLTKEQKRILAQCLRSGRYQRDNEVEQLSMRDKILEQGIRLAREYDVMWQRTRDELLAALSGDPVARAENYKKVQLMRQREERGEDCAACMIDPARCRYHGEAS